MFASLGAAVVRRPWMTILAWVVGTVVVALTAPALRATGDPAPETADALR